MSLKSLIGKGLLLVPFVLQLYAGSAQATSHELSLLAVQENGRIKPYDTFARENLQMVYGKETYEGKPAVDVVMTWVLQPSMWEKAKLIEVNYHLLKKALKLDESAKYFSPAEIWSNERLATIFQELDAKRETKAKLDPYDQSVQRLETQLMVLKELATGRLLKIFPNKQEGAGWRSIAEMDDSEGALLQDFTKSFAHYLQSQVEGGAVDEAGVDAAAKALRNKARSLDEAQYPDEKSLELEVFYNHFHPYRWAWILYALAAFSLMISWAMDRKPLYTTGWAFVILGIVLHVTGMAMRIYLMGRPPVTNMFETVVWVGFGAVIFSIIIEAFYRWRFILMAGAFVGSFCLVLANLAPAVLDPSLQPLEPVLRSNFWLTIHVMTITISYAAFFLAFALGDVALFYHFRNPNPNDPKFKALVLSIYRAQQIGISFLAPGIILGGIWADYSWGRFWGWDPKETWALIVLLGYLAILHGRLVGWIKDFGMAVAAVITFSLVIMAWYGVNFVLGAGLHSYGFGAGGVEYVATFVALHFVYVAFVTVIHRGRTAKPA